MWFLDKNDDYIMKLRLKTIEGEKSLYKNYIIVYHKKLKKDFPPYFKMSLIGMKELARNISKKTRYISNTRLIRNTAPAMKW